MYRGLVRRRIVSNFARLTAGEPASVVAQLADDSQKVARACEQMAAMGIEEASAPPITD